LVFGVVDFFHGRIGRMDGRGRLLCTLVSDGVERTQNVGIDVVGRGVVVDYLAYDSCITGTIARIIGCGE
jgi:hypothetical protein